MITLSGGEVLHTKRTNKSAPSCDRKWLGEDPSSLRWMRSLRMDRSAAVLLIWPRPSAATVQHMTVKKPKHPVLINETVTAGCTYLPHTGYCCSVAIYLRSVVITPDFISWCSQGLSFLFRANIFFSSHFSLKSVSRTWREYTHITSL